MAPHSAQTNPQPVGYAAGLPAPHYFPQPAVPPPPRVVWPWPVFILGVCALAAVWYGRPYWRPTDADRVERELVEMRSLLNRPSPDLNRVMTLGQKAVDLGPRYPQYVGEAHYLLGCACLKKADDAADPDGEWREARAHFEQAEAAGVREADQPRLAFRLGKAMHLCKEDPKKVLEYLKKGDDPDAAAERLQLLAECCLNQKPEADLKGAIEATANQIPLITQADARARSQAYYRLAELQLRAGQVAPARKALEEIKAADAPELYDSSRVLLARCHQADGSYAMAAATWEQVRTRPKPPVEKGVIAYELGWCYWKAGRLDEARRTWDEAQAFGGEAAQASLIRKAELQLADLPNRAAAIPTLEDAFKAVHKPSDFRNSLCSVIQVRELLDKSCHEFQATGDWASAGKLADLLTRLSGAAKGKELAVEIAVSWGVALQTEARAKSGQAAAHALEESARQFRTAATLAAELADPQRPPAEQADWLHKAAKYYLKCSDKVDVQNAVAMLDRVLALSPGGSLEGEVAYNKAMALATLGETDKAIEAYRACVKSGNPCLARARYEMVRLIYQQPAANKQEEAKRLDEIAEALAKNLDPALRDVEADVTENSTYLMGHISFSKRDWVKAEAHLSAALRQYAKSPEASNARFLLGRCYWFMAGRESPAAHDAKLPDSEREAAKKRMTGLLEKARAIFEPLENELMERSHDHALSEADQQTLRQASFAAAECYFFMENFTEAVRRYNELRLRYSGQVMELVALSQLWYSYAIYLELPDKAETTILAIRDLLKSLPKEVFDGSSSIHRREFWDDWLKRVTRPAGPMTAHP